MREESDQVAERVRQLLREYADDPSDGNADEQPDDLPPPGRSWRHAVARAAARLPVRIDPGRGTALAVGVAVLAAALVTGGWVLLERPASVPVTTSAPSGVAAVSATPVGTAGPVSPVASVSSTGGSSGALPSSGSASTTQVVVDVAGKVHRPGLYRLAAGSRIDDAVRAAGGPVHGVDLSSLNLAQQLADGQQIVVGAPAGAGVVGGSPGVPASSGGAANGTATAGTPVNLNSATLEQLETLPGVGPVLAQHILDWRTEHGSFTDIGQLDDVTGIGTVKFAALKPLVTV